MPLNLAALAEIKARIQAAIEAEAGAILDDANTRIPRDTDTAMNSGRVLVDGETTSITYGKDDDANPKTHTSSNRYIVALHEDSAAVHPNGQAHFLQDAADAAQPGIVQRVADRAKV